MKSSPTELRVRRVAFWKKHQTILQNCADLSNLCGMKILVSFESASSPLDPILIPSSSSSQCIMSIPADKIDVSGQQREVQWDDATGNIHALSTGCSTIVFDSFSSEQDVHRRNTGVNNISKLNNPGQRFAADFNVRVSGEVTAILSASSVASYRVTDEKRKPQPPPEPVPASFSSVIANGGGNNGSPMHSSFSPSMMVSSASSNSASPLVVSGTTPLPAVHSPTDSELIASLAAAAPSSSTTSPSSSMSLLDALSMVANQRVRPTAASDVRTDQLRKRCHEMLQQRGRGRAAVVNRHNNVHFQSVVFPPSSSERRDEPCSAGGVVADDRAGEQPPHPPSTTSFFASVPRPREVHQTLMQATQNRRPSPPLPAEASHPLCCNGSATVPPGAVPVASYSHVCATAPPPSVSFAQSLSTSICGNSGNGTAGNTRLDSPGSPTEARFPFGADATPMAEVMADGGSAFTPLRRRRNPLPAFDEPYYDHQHACDQQPRLSSLDLHFTSIVCPVPVAGLLNFSDMHFRRSSEELIALSVLQDLHMSK